MPMQESIEFMQQLELSERDAKIADQKEINEDYMASNSDLAAEVKDLRDGSAAVEELARFEQGMIKQGELFVQILGSSQKSGPQQ